jgi:hypothetical protein
MHAFKILAAALAVCVPSLAGCASAVGEPEDVTGEAQQEAIQLNAIQLNAIQLNAIQLNAIQLNAIQLNAIQLNGIPSDPLIMASLTDPATRKVWEYIVGCALPAGESLTVDVEGTSYTWAGSLGLAPQWAHTSCGETCQEWVSACVLSRVDYLGQEVLISMRGDKPGLDTTRAERRTYTEREATYYGNIFASPQRLYACMSPDKSEIPRVCGPSVDNCGIEVLGTCDDLCGRPRADGSFPDCRVPAPDGHGHGCGRAHDDTYHASITVYLQP